LITGRPGAVLGSAVDRRSWSRSTTRPTLPGWSWMPRAWLSRGLAALIWLQRRCTSRHAPACRGVKLTWRTRDCPWPD